MTAWSSSVDLERDEFLRALGRHGFTISDDGQLHGDLDVPSRPVPVPLRITLPEAFPYAPPVVIPVEGDGGLSWHQESADGSGRFHALCLYSNEEDGLPWLDADSFLAKVTDWFTNDAAGWPNDPPDLDLERYWDVDPGLIIYDDLESYVDAPLGAKPLRANAWRVVVGKGGNRAWPTRLVDVGELERPLRSWSDLADALGANAADVERRIRAKKGLKVLLVRYERSGLVGVLGLVVSNRNPIEFRSVATAGADSETLLLRTGFDAGVLADASVAVVGLGAIGSVVAELLARAGVGRLTVVDGDVMRPGNSVRHVLGETSWGANKAEAMAQHLLAQPWCGTEVTADSTPLRTPAGVADLLTSNDLVIDATASGRVTPLVWDSSSALQRPALFACVQRSGAIARVDRAPLRDGESWLAAVPAVRSGEPELREGGWGDPVSPTPAWSATHAATLTVAMAVDQLRGRGEYGPTTIDVLVAQDDAPFQQVGRLP